MTPDTAPVHEPPVAGDETDNLIGCLEQQRRIFAWKCADLDTAGMRATVGVSTMTLGGLLKHMALVEDHHFASRMLAQEPGEPWSGVDFDADPDWEWRTAADDSPEDLMALWRDMVALSRRRVADAVAIDGMATLGRYVTKAGESPNLRRCLVDLIAEYARHAGHADLIRETVDGRVGEDPPEEFEA